MIDNFRKTKKADISILIVFPLLASAISLIFKTNFLTSILLFYGLPSLWFALKRPSRVLKNFVFTFLLFIPFGIILDHLGTFNQQWFVPFSVFPFRFFDIVPIEDLLWGFFTVFYVITFYSYFVDKGKNEVIDKKMKFILWPAYLLLSFYLIVASISPDLLIINYAYFWIGTIFILLPTTAFLFLYPRLILKFIPVAIYFFVIAFIFELTSLSLGQWSFPSNYIGWISIFDLNFPIEEFFFWFVMAATGTLSYYEFFDDDRK